VLSTSHPQRSGFCYRQILLSIFNCLSTPECGLVGQEYRIDFIARSFSKHEYRQRREDHFVSKGTWVLPGKLLPASSCFLRGYLQKSKHLHPRLDDIDSIIRLDWRGRCNRKKAFLSFPGSCLILSSGYREEKRPVLEWVLQLWISFRMKWV